MNNNNIRYSCTDSFSRDPGEDFTPEAIAAQVRAFEAAGGKAQVIPAGLTTYQSAGESGKGGRVNLTLHKGGK